MPRVQTPDAVVSVTPSSLADPTSLEDQLQRVGSQTAVYVVGVLLGRALSFLLLPVYTRYLSPADYGVIQLIDLTFDVLTLVAGTRLSAGLFHFYEKASTADQKNAVLSTTTIALAGAYAIVAALAVVFASTLSQLVFDSADHTTVIRIAAAAFFFQGLLIVPLAEIRRREQPGLFVVLNTGKLFVQAALNVFFLVVMRYGLVSIFLSTLITSAAFAIGLTIYLLRQSGLRFSSPVLRDLIRFGLPLVATQVATIFTTFGDRFFLRSAVDAAPDQQISGVAVVGIYALAYQFGFLLATLALDPFSSVWQPVRFKFARQRNRDVIFSRAFVMLNLLLVTVGVGIGLFAQDLLNILAEPAFRSASSFVPLLLLAFVVASWPAALDTGIMVRERNEFITFANWAAAGIALLGYLFLIPRFFAWGAVWTTLAAAITRHIIIYRASQRLWPIKYDWPAVWKLLGIGSGLVALRVLVQTDRLAISIGLSVVLFVVYVLAVWYSDLLPQSIRQSLLRGVRSPRKVMLSSLQDSPPSPGASLRETIPPETAAVATPMAHPTVSPAPNFARPAAKADDAETSLSSVEVSVIIPVYGTAHLVAEALDSVLSQTYGDCEIIVVNDGSPDSKMLDEVLEPYRDRITYIVQENRGSGGARNTGIKAARGEYVAMLDSDDRWHPEYMASQLKILKADPTIDVVYSDAVRFNSRGTGTRRYSDEYPLGGKVSFQRVLARECHIYGEVTARRETLLRVGLYDEDLPTGEDFELWLRVLKAGGRIVYNDRVLAYYRTREGSLTSNDVRLAANLLKTLDKVDKEMQLTAEERATLRHQRERAVAHISRLEGKRAFIEGDPLGAIAKLTVAANHTGSWKLRAAILALRFAPALLLWVYRRREQRDNRSHALRNEPNR